MIIFFLFLVGVIIFSAFMYSKSGQKNNQISYQETEIKNKEPIGMYFMNLHSELQKKYRETENFYFLDEYYYLLGCASQGRLDEVKEIIANTEDELLKTFLDSFEPQILKMAKISKEVDDKPIGNDMKNGESIGEYFDRKISKRPTFMKEYEFFKNFDIHKFINDNP